MKGWSMKLNSMDEKWIAALRRFVGDGTGPVPMWLNPDGSVNAEKTVDRAFEMYNIKPKATT
jgi:hypothetical protein